MGTNNKKSNDKQMNKTILPTANLDLVGVGSNESITSISIAVPDKSTSSISPGPAVPSADIKHDDKPSPLAPPERNKELRVKDDFRPKDKEHNESPKNDENVKDHIHKEKKSR